MRHGFAVTLEVQGPILTAASGAGAIGLDALAARDHEGRPVIHGTHLLGKLRDTAKRLQETADAAKRVLAALGEADLGCGQSRKSLRFGDLFARDPVPSDRARTRIAMDKGNGTAHDGALQTLDTPFAAGGRVSFSGELSILGDAEESETLARDIQTLLRFVPQLGGERSTGFGRLLDATIEPAPANSWTTLPLAAENALASPRWHLILRLREPFCVAGTPVDGNLFKGEDAIPGGALKGAIATMRAAAAGNVRDRSIATTLAEHSLLARWFDQLRIGHATPTRPAVADTRTIESTQTDLTQTLQLSRRRPWPFSLASAKGELLDLALTDGPCLVDGEAPAFLHDWKSEWGAVKAHFGWDAPQRQLLVRTAMDPASRTSKTAALFAYEMVQTHAHLWQGFLDLADIDETDRPAVIRELNDLLQNGLLGIGKTDAVADIRLEPDRTGGPIPPDETGFLTELDGNQQPCWVLTLATPALLVSPEACRHKAPWDAAKRLHTAYDQSFQELSDGEIRLVRHFTWHKLSGGIFQAARYMRGRTYRPWLLTETGSTFVLRPTGKPDDARQHLLTWHRHGLRLPESVRTFYELQGTDHDLWRQCPYIHQNGYGEIALNMPEHLTLRPTGHLAPRRIEQ